MKKTITNNVTKSTEVKTEKKPYDDYINSMKSFRNNHNFFNQLLDNALKNPTEANLKKLEEYAAQLPIDDKSPSPC